MARPHPALIDLAADREMQRVDDFDELLRSAFEHRMHGLLWSRVDRGELSGPGEWERTLAMLSLRDEARHRRLWETLRYVTDALSSIGVHVATFKGVTAEARWFDRLGERPCYDVDILVDPSKLGRVDEIVAALDPHHHLLGSFSDLLAKDRVQYLELEVQTTRVDLHFDPLKMGIACRQREVAWDRTVMVEGPAEVATRALDTEMSLLYFLLHLNRDRFRYLLGLTDVSRVLQRETLDWEFFDRFVETEGIGMQVYSSIAAVCTTLGVPNPIPRAPAGWRRAVWTFLWRPHVRLQGHASLRRYWRRGQFVLPLLAQGRADETARMIWARLQRRRRIAGRRARTHPLS